MTEYSNAQLEAAHVHCSAHRTAIEKSNECGCFHCCTIFPASHVIHWIKGRDCEDSAHCPKCGIDSVLGDASGVPINEEFLKEMKNYWF